ncbi:MAG: MBL fold metallo-hydrolase [Pseudomonadota bacterium]
MGAQLTARHNLMHSGNALSTDVAGVRLYWLGQAGFLIHGGGLTLAIDPYLSNALEKKYEGTATPHSRMMPPPVQVNELSSIDYVLCTHRHTDHMDPATLRGLQASNSRVRMIMPLGARDHVLRLGLDLSRVSFINADQSYPLIKDCRVTAIAAAHEQFDKTVDGYYPYLGYAIQFIGFTIYHSGDCVPYEGLNETVGAQNTDLALLPVNGRRPDLQQKGVAGNFTAEEAALLCKAARIPNLIMHHFGMFAFNTVDPEKALSDVLRVNPALTSMAAAVGVEYRLSACRNDAV